jgi:RND superfamily putative drug exporter
MQRALQRSGTAIVASGMTVIISLLVLLFADVGGVRALGPSCAIAVAFALLAGVTLLPALLTIFGRVGFWPRKRLVAYNPSVEVAAPRGIWRKVGDRVLTRPAVALFITLVFFGAGTLGLLAYKEDYSTANFFKKPTESVDGLAALERSLPGGNVDPTTVMVVRDGEEVTPADVEAVQQRLAGDDHIASVTPGERSEDGEIQSVDVVFAGDPYSEQAINSIPELRDRLGDSVPGAEVLVGGGTATNFDFDAANDRDLKVIVPLALLVIAVILGVLLRAVVASLVLIASVIISFFGTLGLSIFFFTKIVGDPGIDGGLPTFAFIFLVALGVDYTIFLMSRVREEARTHGTREGVLRALTATGPVITSAGIILAGTFSVLMTLPVTFAFNIGFLVAVGILLDTFVVRTIMVPAAIELLGDKVWWPSTAQGGGGALREDTGDHGDEAREAVAAARE